MNRPIQHSAVSRPPVPILGVLVIYEDLLASELGRGIAKCIAGSEFALASWDAALLDEEYFTDHIARVAAESVMIIIAHRGKQPLSSSLQKWIRRWATEDTRGSHGIVVALEDATGSVCHATSDFLRETAREAQRQFFRQVKDTSDETDVAGRHDLFWVI